MEKVFLFETTGFSMWPFLKAGSKLFVKRVPPEKLKKGDIILYRENNKVICHRLVKKAASGQSYLFWARADNALSLSGPLTEQMYIGKAVALLKKRKVASLCSFRQRLLNQVIIVIVPFLSRAMKITKPCYDRVRGRKNSIR